MVLKLSKLFCLSLSLLPSALHSTEPTETDICIYGSTAGGAAAAVQAARKGQSVVLIEPTRRLGGLTTGGLGQVTLVSLPAGSLNLPKETTPIAHARFRQQIAFVGRVNEHPGAEAVARFHPDFRDAFGIVVTRGDAVLEVESFTVNHGHVCLADEVVQNLERVTSSNSFIQE